MQGALDSSSFNNGEPISTSTAGPLSAASPFVSDKLPTVNGGQSDSYSESMDREPELEPAEEISENGPLLGRRAVALSPDRAVGEETICLKLRISF